MKPLRNRPPARSRLPPPDRSLRWRNPPPFSIFIASLFFSACASALTLPELLRAASDTHPSIRAARQGVRAADQDVEVAQRQYWPSVSAVVESGASQSNAVATRLLRVEQTLWDFGLTRANVKVSQHSVDVATAAMETQRQSTGLQVIEAWGTLLAGFGRKRAAQQMLGQLRLHESMMLRRVAGQLSTQIDLELVNSRILQAQVELTQAQTSIQASITRLTNLTSLPGLEAELATAPPMASRTAIDRQFRMLAESDWDTAANRQPAVLRAVEEMHLSQERINVKRAQAYPQVYGRFDQALNGQRNSTAYVGLRYTPGAGFANFAEESALASRALALEESANAARIEARQSLDLDRDNLRDSSQRAQSLDAAVQGAQRVLESYQRQFTAGRKSWIDLMNAVRELAQNAYSLADANASQASALYRLQLRVNPELLDTQVYETVPPTVVAEAPSAAVEPIAETVADAPPTAETVGGIDPAPLRLAMAMALSLPAAAPVASDSP